MKKISILGCGWLGFPLAKKLIEKGFEVNGSTTSESKLQQLNEAGITPFLISLHENAVYGNVDAFLKSDVLIIDIPPKLRGPEKENFVSKIKNLIPFIEISTVEKVLFISSTSVYADDNSIVTEEKAPNPDSESGIQLAETELLLQQNLQFTTTILRFGGLIGEKRHPIRFMSGKENIENPEAPINLIHQDDCVGIILAILQKDSWNETFNAVAPFHPTRNEYYTAKAISLNLQLPKFSTSFSNGKTVDSEKLMRILEYQFSQKQL